MKRFCCILFFMAALAASMHAAGPESAAMPFTRFPLDAHSLSKGGASLLYTGETGFASFRNAAVIPFSDNILDVGLNYQMFSNDAEKTNIAGIGLSGRIGRLGLAAGYSYHAHPAYEVTGISGEIEDRFSPSDMQANIGIAYGFIDALSLGVNFKYSGSRLAKRMGYDAFSTDIFLMTRIRGFKAAAGVSSLGTKVKSQSGAAYALPMSADLALGYGNVFADKHMVDIEVDGNWYFKEGLAVSAGAEYMYDDLVGVRVGYRYGGKTVIPSFLSFGIGVKFLGLRLDLTYLTASPALNNTFALTLGYSF